MQDLGTLTRPDDTLWDRAIGHMTERIRQSIPMDLAGFPHYGDPKTGTWTTTPDGFWTGGFWVGELWLAGYYHGDEEMRRGAQSWLERLRPRVHSHSVFRGFLFYYGAVPGAVLMGDSTARDLAIEAARSLAARFDETAGIIPLGAQAEESHTVGAYESNIDGLTASPLLLWAARQTDDPELRRIALTHAYRNAEFCVREDGSIVQSASFDPASGKLLKNYTHKGYSSESTWTRAQAWAMLGYSLCATMAPKEDRLLQLAHRVSDWWLRNVPDDLVAYWDFDAPQNPPTERDTSGTAIAAAALLKLSAVHTSRADAVDFARAGRETVRALVRKYLTPVRGADKRPPGILTKGCFEHRTRTALENELIWGDYFLFESLGVLSGRLPSRVL